MTTHIAHLPHRALIRISGPDWASFLKGLCTAHIDRISEEVAQSRFCTLHYGAFLRPQGKMYADCLLQAVTAEEIWLDVPLSARDDLLSKLNMYRLRARVTIEALPNPVFVAFGGALAPGFQADPRAAIVSPDQPFGVSYNEQVATVDAEAWADFRMTLGLSDPGHDFGTDELYAIDANLDLLGGIDFKKGCFVGQELTSRMKRRGQIKNRILPLKLSGAVEKGAEVLLDERKVGEVLTTSNAWALGLMRLDRLSRRELVANDVVVSCSVPAWMTDEIDLNALPE